MDIPMNIIQLAAEVVSSRNDGWNKEAFRERLREIERHSTGDKEVREYIQGVLEKK